MKWNRTVLILCFVGLVIPYQGWGQEPTDTDKPTAVPMQVADRPFSAGLVLGNHVYVSGHVGLDPATNKIPGNASAEARQVMISIQATLAQGGLTMDDLVYVEVYCTDLKLYGTFNKEYVSFFHNPYPARDFIGVKELLFGAHFEVMGIAVKDGALQKKLLSKAE